MSNVAQRNAGRVSPELAAFMARMRKVDEAKELILRAVIDEATSSKISLYDAARALADRLPNEEQRRMLDICQDIIDNYGEKVKSEAWAAALNPCAKEPAR